MAAEGEVDCEWKQLIKILLPPRGSGSKLLIITFTLTLLLGDLSFCSGTLIGSLKGREVIQGRSNSSTSTILPPVTTTPSSSTSSETDRADKVKAKWKENFWSQSVANLTLMESQKATTESATTSRTTLPDAGISSRKMPPQNPSPTSATGSLAFFPLESVRSEGSILKETLSNHTLQEKKTKRGKKHRKKRPPTRFNLPKPSPSPSPSPTLSSSSTSRAKSTGRPLPRTTLTADLSQYGQEYVLEYESEEILETPNHTHSHAPQRLSTTSPKPSKRRNKTKNKSSRTPSKTEYYGVGGSKVKKHRKKSKYGSTFGFPRNSSNSSSTTEATTLAPNPEPESEPEEDLNRATLIADLGPYGQDAYLEYESDEEVEILGNGTGNGTISLQFFPKNPVNLLHVLQALAANMQPIKMASPVGGEAPSIPIRYNVNFTNRVPVKMNPPSSPFLFSLDLDSFFTRMVISLFYSSVAIAPLVYLMMGGLGGLSSLSIAPFTGRRRRRDLQEETLTFLQEEDQLLDKLQEENVTR